MAISDLFFFLVIALFVSSTAGDAIHGCGGFVEASSSLIKSRKASDTRLDYSHITVELCTIDGLVKDRTQCAPNGYYFIPVYDKGSFIVRVKGPDGWSFEPDTVPVIIDQNGCNANADINFRFTGFMISGGVKGAVGGESCSLKDGGPSGVAVELLSPSDDFIASVQTSATGDYSFTNIIPGKYKLHASHPNLEIEVRGSPEVNLGFGNIVVDDIFFVLGYDLHGFVVAQKMGSSGQRNAARCGLWWAEMLKARGQYKEAAIVYFRISNEEPSLHAAILLEQASYCYLLSNPPLLRKYGFHLILAGNRYYISEQRQHAIRSYRNALFVYKGNAWTYITNHVHFNIGRWYAFLGMFDVAIKHMLEVLACSHQSLATQTLFLSDFFHVVQSMGKLFEVYKLQLPVINMASLKVFYEDTRTYASSADVQVGESVWQALEEEMVPSMSTVRSNWLDSQPKTSPLKKYNSSCVCVAGEAIKLDLEFKNPLQISISVSGVSLICELSAESGAANFDNSASETALQEDGEFRKPPSCRDPSDDSSLMLSKFDFVLKGGETKRIQLKVTPRVEGILKIVGVRWTLSDSVVGYQYFEFDTKKNKKGRKGARHSLQRNLNFIVIKGLPKLEGCIHHLPKKTFTGDLRLLMLELRNQSEYSVKNMKMKISHARFLIPGSSADLNLDFPRCLEKQIGSVGNDVPGDIMEKSRNLLFSFPSNASIQGGTTFMWPLWFHAGLCGSISFYISVYYEMESSSDMTYRTLRMHYNLEVLPSLDVSFLITPCPSRLQGFRVRMDVMNRTSSEMFCLNQLSCVGDQWDISTLPGHVSICPTQTLSAGQALSCFFKLKDCRSANKERNLSVLGSDVLLGSQGSNKVLIDISRSPLVDFHHHERYYQGKLMQGSPSIVDFILVSRIVGGNPDVAPEASSQLLSHHACHCSITSRSPIWWLMDGPRMINHDFSTSFCEVSVRVTIRNCSETSLSIRLATFDTLPGTDLTSDAFQSSDPSGNQGGWHDVSLVDEIKVISNVQASRPRRPLSESLSPYVWCGANSTRLKLEPACTAEVPLRICVFTPGTYDLSNYELHWKLQSSEEGLGEDVKRWSSGTSRGHPFYLTALQCPS